MALIDRSVHNHSVILYIGNPNKAIISDSGYRYINPFLERKATPPPVINISDRFNSYASFVISVGPEYKDDFLFSFDCDGGYVFKSAAGFTFNKSILDVNLMYKWKNTNPSGILAGRIKEKILETIDSIAKADVNITMGFASALKDIYFFYTNILGMDLGQDLAAHMKTLLFFITQGKITLPEKDTAIFEDFDFNMPDLGVHKVYITLTDNPDDASINQAIQDMRNLRLMPRLLSYAKKLEAYQRSQSDAIYEPLQYAPYDRSNEYGYFSGLRVKQLPLIRINDLPKAIQNKDQPVILKSQDVDGKTEDIDFGLRLIEAFAFSFGCYIYANSNQTYKPLLSLFTSIAQRTYPNISEGDLYDMYIKNWTSSDLMDNIIDILANKILGLNIDEKIMDTLAYYWCNEVTLASKEFSGNMIGTFLLEFFDYSDDEWKQIAQIFNVSGGDANVTITNQSNNSEQTVTQQDVGNAIISYLKKQTLSGAPRSGMPKAKESIGFIKEFINMLADCRNGSPFIQQNLVPLPASGNIGELSRNIVMGRSTINRCKEVKNLVEETTKIKEELKEMAKKETEWYKQVLIRLTNALNTMKFSLTRMIISQNKIDVGSMVDLVIQQALQNYLGPLRSDTDYMATIARQVYSSPSEISKLSLVKNAAVLVAQKLVEMLSKLGFIMFLPPSGYNFIPDFRAIVAAIVNDVPCVQLFSSTDNIEDDNITYVVSYYGIVMRNVKRMKILNDNTLTQQGLFYLVPENITIESSNVFTYTSNSFHYGRLGYPTWVKLSLTFKPMHKWIFFFGNYYNLKILYDLLETGKALAQAAASSSGTSGGTTGSSRSASLPSGLSTSQDLSNEINCPQ